MLILLTTAVIAYLVVGHLKAQKWPFDKGLLRQIPKGATQEEIKKVLGEPQEIYNNNHSWSYYRNAGSYVVHVDFDDNFLFDGYCLNDRD
jgi:hypothetical protein